MQVSKVKLDSASPLQSGRKSGRLFAASKAAFQKAMQQKVFSQILAIVKWTDPRPLYTLCIRTGKRRNFLFLCLVRQAISNLQPRSTGCCTPIWGVSRSAFRRPVLRLLISIGLCTSQSHQGNGKNWWKKQCANRCAWVPTSPIQARACEASPALSLCLRISAFAVINGNADPSI